MIELKTTYLPGPKAMTYTYQGMRRLLSGTYRSEITK